MIPTLETVSLPHFGHASDYVGAWAIEPQAGHALLSLCQRTDLFAHVANAPDRKADTSYQIAKSGKENVAIVMLTGPLMKSVGSMQAGTSTVEARRAIRKAAADPDVSAIMLAIDSPGGTLSGTETLSADVKAASRQKPVWAFIDDLGASAAYFVASQADKIFANTGSALVGSIGTLMVVYDLSKAAENEGVKTLVFGTGPLKGAGAPGSPISEEQQDYFQKMVEEGQQSFDAAVQKGRGLTDKQLASVKTGGVFSANEALAKKLIDGIQSFDATIAQLAATARRESPSKVRAESPVTRSLAVNETNEATLDVKAIADAAVKAQNEALAANADRIAALEAECVGHPAILAQAIREGWSAEKAENKVLKAKLASDVRTAIPGQINRSGTPSLPNGVTTSEALEAGVMMSLGRKNLESQYRPEVLEAAHRNYRRIGLQQLLLMGAVQNGYRGSVGEKINTGNARTILKYAFTDQGEDRMAASSSIAMGGILGAVANKEIVAGYEEMDNSWREIAAIKSVSNFQQYTTYRMLDDMEYEELGPDGKIKHATAGQESYTRQVKSYAKMFKLTLQDIVNDDLGAFDDLRTRIGRGASKAVSKKFWTIFMGALGTTFTSTRTNYISGSTTNLGTDGVGLSLGVKAFRTMKSPSGAAPDSADGAKRVNANTQNPVGSNPGGRPEILLVSPDLEGNAEVLYRNQNLNQVKNSDANIHQNKYRPVVAWQLSDSGYSGYSTTMWFLLNSPAYLASMAVSFLDGNQAPTVEQADADFDELGVQFRGVTHFGCDVAEYLAGVMSKGAN